MLCKQPGVTAVAVITLALGIGANTAIFSVVNAVILRPLPYKNPDRLVSLWENVPVRGRWRVTPANYLDWKKQNTTFADMAAFGAGSMTLTGGGEPEQLLGTRASAGYFNVIGVEPVLGRAFTAEEYEPGKGRVAILSHNFWQRRFGGNPNIVNQSITLDGATFIVVGVMPQAIYPSWPNAAGKYSFDQTQQQFWIPMSFNAQVAALRTAHVLGVLGRMKPGVTIEQAQADMNAIGVRLEREYAANKGEGIIVNDFMNEMVGNVKPVLMTLLGAVGLVLLIACANIAGLLLAQHATRSREVAIRSALGAARSTLMRQFVSESLLLSAIGTAAGLVLARVGITLILKLVPDELPRFSQTQLNWRVLSFTIGLSFVTCLLFGLLPAWQASKPDLQATLEQGRRVSGMAPAKQRFRQALVVFQICVAVMLVIGAGLLMKSFWRLRSVDPGFKAANVLSLSVTLPRSKYDSQQKINTFYNDLVERLATLPGVEAASIAYDHPLQSNWIDSFSIEGRPPVPGESLSANFSPVSIDYFRTVGVSLISGRLFTPQDDPDHPGVTVVNEAFVRRHFPHEKPLGKKLQLNAPARLWNNQKLTSFEIVGIVRDVKSAGLSAAAEPAYYVPAVQGPVVDMTVLIRAKDDPTAMLPALRRTVWSLDSDQPIANIATMEKIVDDSIAQPRLSMTLMGLFGGLALVLAAVGIYGLLSYAVAQRTQEMGIRIALGAQVTDVLGLIMKQGLLLVVAGEVLGLIGSFALTRVIGSLLFGVTPTDTTTFAAVAVVLATVALLACYIPARRATKVDPMVALRTE